jgi:hypothetical protein
MFWGLNTKAPDAATASGNDLNHDDIALRAVCVCQNLTATYMIGTCLMYDAEDAFNYPLKWWKEN